MKNIKKMRLLRKNIMVKCTKEDLYMILYSEYKNNNVTYNNVTFGINTQNDFSFYFKATDGQGTEHFCELDRIVDDILSYINEEDHLISDNMPQLHLSEIYIRNHIKASLKRYWTKIAIEKEYYNDL